MLKDIQNLRLFYNTENKSGENRLNTAPCGESGETDPCVVVASRYDLPNKKRPAFP